MHAIPAFIWLIQGCRQLVRSGGGLSLYKASGSNLRMVRPSLIHVRKVCGKILNLASYLAVRRRSHFTSVQTGGYHITLFSCLARNLKFDTILRKHDFSYCNQCCEREKLQCIAQVENLATYNKHSKFD